MQSAAASRSVRRWLSKAQSNKRLEAPSRFRLLSSSLAQRAAVLRRTIVPRCYLRVQSRSIESQRRRNRRLYAYGLAMAKLSLIGPGAVCLVAIAVPVAKVPYHLL